MPKQEAAERLLDQIFDHPEVERLAIVRDDEQDWVVTVVDLRISTPRIVRGNGDDLYHTLKRMKQEIRENL